MKYIDIASAQQFVWWAVARKWDVTQCDIDSWSHHQHHQHHQNNHFYIIIIIIFTIIYRSSSSLYLGNEMSPHVIYTLSSSATLQLNLDRNHFNNKVKKYITLLIWVWLISSSQKIWWWWSWLWIHLVERVLWKLSCWHGQSFGTGPPLPLQWIPTANIYMAPCIMKYNTYFYPNALVTGLQDTIHDMFCCLNLMQL